MKPKSASLTYVDSNTSKYIYFNSQKEMDAFREKMIQKFMKEDGTNRMSATQTFNDIYSTAREWIRDDPDFPFYGKIPDKYWVEATIPDAKEIEQFYQNIKSWKDDSDARTAKWLAQNIKYWDKGKSKNPEIFRPDVRKGTPVYRGVDITSGIKAVIKKTKWEDWERTEFKAGRGEKDYWYTYRGKFAYTPHRPVQSWTVTPKAIMDHFYESEDSVILTKRLDDEFYFSNKFLDWASGGDYKGENEVIRIAGKGPDVNMLATRRTIMLVKGHEFSERDIRNMDKRGGSHAAGI